jgi:hypothetical protein
MEQTATDFLLKCLIAVIPVLLQALFKKKLGGAFNAPWFAYPTTVDQLSGRKIVTMA